jgi:hypothetical protein
MSRYPKRPLSEHTDKCSQINKGIIIPSPTSDLLNGMDMPCPPDISNGVSLQLDTRTIKDKKNRPRKRKHREQTKSYVHHLPVDGLESFDIRNSVLVMDIQERRAGPEDYARLVKEGLKRENGVEKFY